MFGQGLRVAKDRACAQLPAAKEGGTPYLGIWYPRSDLFSLALHLFRFPRFTLRAVGIRGFSIAQLPVTLEDIDEVWDQTGTEETSSGSEENSSDPGTTTASTVDVVEAPQDPKATTVGDQEKGLQHDNAKYEAGEKEPKEGEEDEEGDADGEGVQEDDEREGDGEGEGDGEAGVKEEREEDGEEGGGEEGGEEEVEKGREEEEGVCENME